MRIFIKNLFIISLFILTASIAKAQKIGFVDIEVIKTTLGDFKKIETKLMGVKKSYEDTLKIMQTEFQQGVEAYQKQAALMNAEAKSKEEERLGGIRERVLKYNEEKFGNSGELARSQAEMVRPIMEKVKSAIEQVSKSDKLSAVFETSMTAFYDKKSDITFKILDIIKKVKSKLFNSVYFSILIVLLTLSIMPIASAQKLGYVSSVALMDKFPEAKTALGKLSEFQINWLNDIENQEKSIRIQKDSIFNNRLLWSSQERKDADSKLSELISKLSSFRLGKFGENGEYEKKQLEIMNPVLDKISKAIEDEAKSQKMDFIFDKSNRTLPMLYSNPNNDISVLVLKRLGVDISKDSLNSNQKDSQKDVMNARGKGRDENPQQNQVPKFDPNDLLNGIKPDAPAKEVVKPNK